MAFIPGNLVLPYESSVIGTGMMGSQLAIRLAKRGHKVIVFNRDRAKAQIVQHSVADNKIRVASTPAEVGNNSKFVILCVRRPPSHFGYNYC